jgi:hypothetical protein
MVARLTYCIHQEISRTASKARSLTIQPHNIKQVILKIKYYLPGDVMVSVIIMYKGVSLSLIAAAEKCLIFNISFWKVCT